MPMDVANLINDEENWALCHEHRRYTKEPDVFHLVHSRVTWEELHEENRRTVKGKGTEQSARKREIQGVGKAGGLGGKDERHRVCWVERRHRWTRNGGCWRRGRTGHQAAECPSMCSVDFEDEEDERRQRT